MQVGQEAKQGCIIIKQARVVVGGGKEEAILLHQAEEVWVEKCVK
ncbi:MAG TPA: hypothetical protein VJ602_00135 [Paludibacter sp.]|nr:hypothetical protein [Paludibacter sp.]